MGKQINGKIEFNGILKDIEKYYNDKLNVYGATARGVDWNSAESQILRFEQLLKICNNDKYFSINDYGCGYGALVDYMLDKEYRFKYQGFDISNNMINKALDIHKNMDFCRFYADESLLNVSDYTVASGIFNVRLEVEDYKWMEYILFILRKIEKLSNKGFAFNMLTIYADNNFKRADLYYADPCFYFDYCKKYFSRKVSLLHDYNLYEFSILVKK